jgi:hypothetical protein
LGVERDLWAGRARLLAEAMVQEAGSVQPVAARGDDAPSAAANTLAA